MEEGLIALLTASPAVSGIVGARVHFGRLPQGKPLPALVLHRIPGGGPGYTLKGEDGLELGFFQLDAWAHTPLAAIQLRRAAVGVLSGHRDAAFRGVFAGRPHGGFEQAPGPPAPGVPTEIHRASQDLRAWRRSTP